MRFPFFLIPFLLLATLFGASFLYAAEVHIQGSTTVFATFFHDHRQRIEEISGVHLTIIANGSSRGLDALLRGETDIAMISSDLESLRPTVEHAHAISELQAFPLPTTRVAFAVHPSNPLRTIDDATLRGILLGKIVSWQELGVPSGELITPVAEYPGGGIRRLVENSFLKGQPLTLRTKIVPNGSRIVGTVENMPNGFAITTHAQLKGSSLTELSGHSPITQPLTLLTRGTPTPEIQRVLNAVNQINFERTPLN